MNNNNNNNNRTTSTSTYIDTSAANNIKAGFRLYRNKDATTTYPLTKTTAILQDNNDDDDDDDDENGIQYRILDEQRKVAFNFVYLFRQRQQQQKKS